MYVLESLIQSNFTTSEPTSLLLRSRTELEGRQFKYVELWGDIRQLVLKKYL